MSSAGARLIIHHRVNSAAQLARVPAEQGVEIDLREAGGRLCLAHEPFSAGEPFADWLRAYRQTLCVLNVKADGLEEAVLREAAGRLKDYFFLDCSAPTLVKLARRGERKLAVRFSEFEPLPACLAFAGLADWAWVDCFTRLPLDASSYSALKRHFKLCLVSPELQGQGRAAIPAYRERLKALGAELDAVCTDFPGDWA